MTSADYLKAVMERHHVTSIYGAAKLIGTTNNTPTNWQLGKSMSDKHARKVAHLLDIPEAVVLMDVTAEKTKDENAKALYQGMADALRDTPLEALPPALQDVVTGRLYIM